MGSGAGTRLSLSRRRFGLWSQARRWRQRQKRSLGVVEQTLANWVKLHRAGKLKGAIGKGAVTAEQMEISRLRAELARVTMERDILGKATAFFAKGQK